MSRITDDELDQLFKTFEHTAFRLEVRDRYDAPYSAESVKRFLAGNPEDPDNRTWFKSWTDMIREITDEGKLVERVRVVSVPLSDYSRYSLWSAQTNNAAGEDIRFLARDHAEGLPNYDYWLFDSRQLVWMHFDDEDRFVGAEIIDDPAEVVRHNYWRDLAWHRAIRREEFAAK